MHSRQPASLSPAPGGGTGKGPRRNVQPTCDGLHVADGVGAVRPTWRLTAAPSLRTSTVLPQYLAVVPGMPCRMLSAKRWRRKTRL